VWRGGGDILGGGRRPSGEGYNAFRTPAYRQSRPKAELKRVVGTVPESDAAYPIIAAILRVVPASRWAFARLRRDGELADLLLDSPEGNAGELLRLKTEFERQRKKAKTGPRIAATIGPLGDFESGITLLFADARASFGILTLLRTSELGPFTSSELSVLALSLDATSERLSALRLNSSGIRRHAHPSVDARSRSSARAAEPSEEAFYILDRDFQIVLAWTAEEQRRVALTGLRTRVADRLPAVLEEAVRELIAGWRTEAGAPKSGIAHPVPFLVVRTEPMSGPAGLFIGVRIDRFKPPNSLRGPAARFHISPRELQVLALLLDGAKLDEISRKLQIAYSTIAHHIRSMIDKTGSRNRTELIARVLGWENT
jgi:DNA-binding CsgD family transcriptional regulator